MPELQIRPLVADDWSSVHKIYCDGISTGNATFEASPPDWEHFDAGKLTAGRLVAIDRPTGMIIGWTALAPISARAVYRGVAEHSIYIAAGARGCGVGRQLLTSMIIAADRAGIWTIQSSIFPENSVSLRLHQAVGFRTVGRRERIARMTHGPWAGRWRDTILIERRSTSTGR